MKIKRKISVFQLLMNLLFLAGALIFYLNNIIAVDQLIVYNNQLKNEIVKYQQNNNILMMERNKLLSYERIKSIAIEKLGLNLYDHNFDANLFFINRSKLNR
jgi:cell division protein FtsL